MVFNALYAFSAADSRVNAESGIQAAYDHQAFSYYSKANSLLSQELGKIYECRMRRERMNVMPVMFAVFLLGGYGVNAQTSAQREDKINARLSQICADAPSILSCMANLSEELRKGTAVFPLRLRFDAHGDVGWRFRILVSNYRSVQC
jgi:hypothetical protein